MAKKHIACQGCGKEIHYGFVHFTDCNNTVANSDCDCLSSMIAVSNRMHSCSYGPELMRDITIQYDEVS